MGLMLGALLAAFCGILYQLTRILLGVPKIARTRDAAPLLFVMKRAAGIVGGEPAQ